MDSMTASLPPYLSIRSLFITFVVFSWSQHLSSAKQLRTDEDFVRRRFLAFRETPSGGNSTFECSPSGPCVPCQYSEKTDDKYRCSETGYRIPFKCVKNGDATKGAGVEKPQNEESLSNVEDTAVEHRKLADDASEQEGEPQAYVTYRSCIQAVDEEKLSVLGFEVLMLGLLLISGSLVFLRRKQTAAMAGIGGVRMQGNPRF